MKDVPGGTANDVYYAYDARGLQTSALFASASGVGITNSYDGFGELLSTTNTMGTTARTLGYTYDADGNRSQLTYPDSSFFTYVYDGLDRLTTIKEAGTTAIVSTVFNPQQTVASQTRGAVTTTLGYDTVSRPTSWADDLAGTTSDVTSTFAYNPASQIVTKTRSNDAYAFNGYVSVSRPYAVNGLNQYATAGSATFTYDDNGNLTGDGTNSYGYDVENRMTSASVSGVGAITLKYDPLGRLWQTIVPGKTIEWTYDGDSLVMEMNGSSPFRFVHGPNEDDPMIQYNGTGYGTRYSLEPDYQGSIVSLADAGGAKFAINAFDEYGITPSSNYGRFQYTGQAWIPGLGLYYYKARMYSPTLGRFMQTDPIGYKDQNNLYTYVGNDPIDGRDPTGERCTGVVDCTVDVVIIAGEAAGESIVAPAITAGTVLVTGGTALIGASVTYSASVNKREVKDRPNLFIPRPPAKAAPVDSRSAADLVMAGRRVGAPYRCSNPLCDTKHGGLTGTTECPECDAKRRNGGNVPGKPRPLPPPKPPRKKPPLRFKID